MQARRRRPSSKDIKLRLLAASTNEEGRANAGSSFQQPRPCLAASRTLTRASSGFHTIPLQELLALAIYSQCRSRGASPSPRHFTELALSWGVSTVALCVQSPVLRGQAPAACSSACERDWFVHARSLPGACGSHHAHCTAPALGRRRFCRSEAQAADRGHTHSGPCLRRALMKVQHGACQLMRLRLGRAVSAPPQDRTPQRTA